MFWWMVPYKKKTPSFKYSKSSIIMGNALCIHLLPLYMRNEVTFYVTTDIWYWISTKAQNILLTIFHNTLVRRTETMYRRLWKFSCVVVSSGVLEIKEKYHCCYVLLAASNKYKTSKHITDHISFFFFFFFFFFFAITFCYYILLAANDFLILCASLGQEWFLFSTDDW